MMKKFLTRISVRCAFLTALCFGNPAGAQLSAYTSSHAFPDLAFASPVCIDSPPGETNRLFILEQDGVIVVITNLAHPTRTVFMDISGRVDAGGEQGLLGLAFHPNYESNGWFYLFYTGPATNGGSGLHDILSRFEVAGADPNQGDTNSELRLIAQLDGQGNHNAGDVHFGADGYLYVSLGDEGGGGDSENNSQRIDKDFFSGILRIDVDQRSGNLPPNPHPAGTTNYLVPADNPFVGATSFNGSSVNPAAVRTEFWAVGLRNPWRWSFDPQTGLAYCGDVGQGAREEIDLIIKGANYGWAYREGNIAGPKSPPPGFTNRIDPIFDYDRTLGNCVIGGVVYRGSRFPDLFGYYVFADIGSGRVWALKYDGTNATAPQELFNDGGISAFGHDPSTGDILYANLNSASIGRIVPVAPPGSLQVTMEPPGAVSAGAQWRVDGGSFHNSGNTVGLGAGEHTVSFKSISNWKAPGNKTVNIASGLTTITNGTYISTDTTRPTITITNPISGERLPGDRNFFEASGTVHDNTTISEIWLQPNDYDWRLAQFNPAHTNWHQQGLQVVPGFNTLRACAVDQNGNVSRTNSVTFFSVVTVPLTVQIAGSGKVTTNYHGQYLEIGQTYSMTARSDKGFKFVNWTGSLVTDKPKLTFVMASNLTFTANFADAKRPKVMVTYPPVNKRVTNAFLTATGRASDNVGVAEVGYRLNGATWNPAATTNAWTNWTAAGLVPNAGQNLLRAWAVDDDGNASRTNSVKFTYQVVASADWAPDTLSGLTAQVLPDTNSPSNLNFDALTFSRTGADTNDEFSVGQYTYVKTGTNTAQLILANTAPPTQTNDPADNMELVFTNHYLGAFSDEDGAGNISFSIATNFAPTSLTGKRIVATGSHGTYSVSLKSKGTFTLTPSPSDPAASSTGTYTFTRHSLVGAMLVLTFTGAEAGTVSWVQLNFHSSKSGNFLATTLDGAGNPTDFDPGTFELR